MKFVKGEASVSFQVEVPILRVLDNQPVTALLMTLTQNHLDDFEVFWKAQLRSSTQEDRFWDWEEKKKIFLGGDGYEGYAIEYQQLTQGLMLIQTRGHRSQFDPSRRIVYIRFLSTAPWNRSSSRDPKGFRAIGRTFLKFAQFRSEELGYAGLVGLHSLPGSEDFYRRLNMIDCGSDQENDNLTYFEWYRPRQSLLDELDL